MVYASSLDVVYLGTQNASIAWYNLNEADSRPPPDPKTHPYIKEDRFFDSKGPGGVSTPRPEYMKEYPLTKTKTQHLQLDRDYIKIFAHYGYVYSMLLIRGLVTDDPDEEVLVSGGGDGAIKLWSLDKEIGAITELCQFGEANGESVLSMALDGTFLIGGMIEGKIKIWDLETRQIVRVLKTNVSDVLALSIGGGCLFAAGANGTIEVCRYATD